MTSRFGNEPDRKPARRRLLCGALMAGFTLLGGCTPPFQRTREETWRLKSVRFQAISMWNESRLKPLEESPDPAHASSSLALPAGTYARGERAIDDPAETGRTGGKLVTTIPIPVTDFMIRRGQERFNIYCSPCHGRLGDGNGLVPSRGFPHPPDYAIARLRKAPVGHFFDVITNGYGVMYSYASRVPAEDRWAIAAYIRVLQASRKEVPLEEYQQERLRGRQIGIRNPRHPSPMPPGTPGMLGMPGAGGAAPGGEMPPAGAAGGANGPAPTFGTPGTPPSIQPGPPGGVPRTTGPRGGM